jgi:hypothetical protein
MGLNVYEEICRQLDGRDPNLKNNGWFLYKVQAGKSSLAELLAARLENPEVNAWAIANGLVTEEGKPCNSVK